MTSAKITKKLEVLSPLLRSALLQCSLFHHSFTAEAVESVLWLKHLDESYWPLDAVEELVQKGLVEKFQPLPHHVRYFVSEEVVDAYPSMVRGESLEIIKRVKSNHAAYYARLGSEQRINSLSLYGGGRLIHILMLEEGNLDEGLRHALAQGEVQSASGLLLAHSRLVNFKGPRGKLDRVFEQVLDFPKIDEILEVRLLTDYARELSVVGNIEKARELAERVRQKTQGLINSHYYAQALGVLGIIALQEGNTQSSLELSEQSLAIHRATGNRMYEGHLLADIGIVHNTIGDIQAARTCHEEALVIHREVGNRRCEGVAMINLALVNTELGEIAIATELYEEAIELVRETSQRRLEGCALGNLGDLYLQKGRLEDAREYLEIAVAISHEVGHKIPEAAFMGSLSELHRREGNLVAARKFINRAEKLVREANDTIELAKVTCRKGWLEVSVNDFDGARKACEESQRLIGELGLAGDHSLALSISELEKQARNHGSENPS